MRELELLAPARNADIGIAAIDCGADAVYIAGPAFGARQAAGNPVEEIRRLCDYAHRFGARVFVTLNTILYDSELAETERLTEQICEAQPAALIVQDLAAAKMAQRFGIPLHASTQCSIRTVEDAKFYEKLGFSRLILERQLPLEQVREIAAAVNCEIEFFVHGALCVCYSGQCYMSEKIAGRSANRGACIQACRSRYDLADKSGRILQRDKALLSLKDYNLKSHLAELAEAGVMSFKIEGRLKNISYVRNVVRDYSLAMDALVQKSGGKYCRASFGTVRKGFTPNVNKTFNRGYTALCINGMRGRWSSMDTAKSMGEELGSVANLSREHNSFSIKPGNHSDTEGRVKLSNGDGLAFIAPNGDVVGVRADVCDGLKVKCKSVPELFEGATVFRNLDTAFEKAMVANPCVRKLDVAVNVQFVATENVIAEDGGNVSGKLTVTATSEDGRTVLKTYTNLWNELASNTERMRGMFETQLSKTSGIYAFRLTGLKYTSATNALSARQDATLPLISAANLNFIRNDIASELDATPCKSRPLYKGIITDKFDGNKVLTYKANVSNETARKIYSDMGCKVAESAYELAHQDNAELMRTKYCIRYELNLCPRQNRKVRTAEPLYLLNNGQKFTAIFDCRNCEMVIK